MYFLSMFLSSLLLLLAPPPSYFETFLQHWYYVCVWRDLVIWELRCVVETSIAQKNEASKMVHKMNSKATWEFEETVCKEDRNIICTILLVVPRDSNSYWFLFNNICFKKKQKRSHICYCIILNISMSKWITFSTRVHNCDFILIFIF